MRRQRDYLHATILEKGVAGNHEAIGSALRNACKSGVDSLDVAGRKDIDGQPKRHRGSACLHDQRLGVRACGIDQRGKSLGARQKLVKEFELLGSKLRGPGCDAGDVGAWAVETRH